MPEDFFDKENELNIVIEKAYIEDLCLNVDIVDKIKDYYQKACEFVETLWNKIIYFCWNVDNNNNKKNKEVNKKNGKETNKD